MTRCAIGERTAELVTRIIRQYPHRTADNIAAITNQEIEHEQMSGLNYPLDARKIVSFLRFHPDGQQIVNEGLMTTPSRNRKE
jgi:hypothetical protein